MKYYSEILKKNYDTVEALEKAEAEAKTKDESAVVKNTSGEISDRKSAAKIVEDAFAHASQVRKDNSAKRDALNEELKAIDKKYDAKFLELQKEYETKNRELSQARDKECEAMDKKFKELDKSDKDILNGAYDKLREFCKKYGAYHYSVDAAGSDLFPMLLGFGQIEKTADLFKNMFNSMFNLW